MTPATWAHERAMAAMGGQAGKWGVFEPPKIMRRAFTASMSRRATC